jgi:hypothetical protein
MVGVNATATVTLAGSRLVYALYVVPIWSAWVIVSFAYPLPGLELPVQLTLLVYGVVMELTSRNIHNSLRNNIVNRPRASRDARRMTALRPDVDHYVQAVMRAQVLASLFRGQRVGQGGPLRAAPGGRQRWRRLGVRRVGSHPAACALATAAIAAIRGTAPAASARCSGACAGLAWSRRDRVARSA